MALADSTEQTPGEAPRKSSKLGLILSVVLAFLGAGAGYFALSYELGSKAHKDSTSSSKGAAAVPAPDVAFVEIPPIIVTLPPGAQNTHLRFVGLIEVPTEFQEDVAFLMPRIQDMLNGYLRALTAEDIEGSGALYIIRLQLFRRIVMVVGLGKANSLLVTEFILN